MYFKHYLTTLYQIYNSLIGEYILEVLKAKRVVEVKGLKSRRKRKKSYKGKGLKSRRKRKKSYKGKGSKSRNKKNRNTRVMVQQQKQSLRVKRVCYRERERECMCVRKREYKVC